MKYKIAIILIAMLLLNGLNNSREINDLAIVSAIGIDKVENGNYIVSAIVLNPEKQDSGSGASSSSDKMTLYEGEDDTIQQAIRKMILESPKKLYLAHMELLLISEDVAKSDLIDSLDFFIRDDEGSSDFVVIISRDVKPREVLQIKTPVEDIPSENIVKSIKAAAQYMGVTTENNLNNSLEYLLEEGQEMVMPSIVVKKVSQNEEKSEDESSSDLQNQQSSEQTQEKSEASSSQKSQEDSKILVDGFAYFKDSKLQGYLDLEESMSHTILTNEFKEGVIKVTGKDNLVAEIIKCGCKMKPKYENGEYIIDINISAICNVTEVGKEINFDGEDNIHDYEELVANKLKTDIQSYISKCQNEYNSDLIGFGKLYREKLNKEYKKVKDSFYTDVFKNIKTNIKVEVNFPNDGGINKKW